MIQISLPDTGNEEWEATRECFETGWLTSGPKVREFEEAFAKRHGAGFGVAATSCTTALHLALAALDIGPGDEVIVPAFTWVATANVVLYCGAEVVFVDIDRFTFNLDSAQVAAKVTGRTKAIVAVHLFGLCADMDALREAAPGIPIIEDAACAVGATYGGVSAGALGLMACFSFHPRKQLTTGEGGMITTSDPSLAESLQTLRNHGAAVSEEQRHNGPQPFILPDFNVLGFNYRMTDIQAAVGMVQLRKLEGSLSERKERVGFYDDRLGALEWLHLPTETLRRLNESSEDAKELVHDGGGTKYQHSWQAFVTVVDPEASPMPRNEIMAKLLAKGISTRPGTHAVHMLGFYADRYGISPGDFPNARFANDHSMAIPLHSRMSEADYEKITRELCNL